MNPQMNMRYVKANGKLYFLAEDIAEYLIECGSGEETDVRNRLKAAAKVFLREDES